MTLKKCEWINYLGWKTAYFVSARDQAKLSWTCLKLFPTIIIRFRPFGTMVIEGGKLSKFCPVDEIFFVPWHFLSKLRFLASRSYLNLLVSTWNVLCLLLIWAQLSKYVKFEKHERLVMSQRWLISLTGWEKSVPWQLWSPVTRLNFITVVYICIPPPPKTYFMKLYVSLCSLDLNHDPIRYRLTLSSALITGHAMHNVHTLDWSLVQ